MTAKKERNKKAITIKSKPRQEKAFKYLTTIDSYSQWLGKQPRDEKKIIIRKSQYTGTKARFCKLKYSQN